MVHSRALTTFESNLASVEELVRFDDRVIDLILTPLQRHRERLVSAEITNRHLLPDNLITTLRNIKSNASLKAHYQALYNQWLVLLVSYFGSAVRDLFIDATAEAIRNHSHEAILKELLVGPVEEFAEAHDDINLFLADLLASGKDISFQDMQSIGRAFHRFFGVGVERDQIVNDIIFAQASRHAIVHGGGVVDRKLIAQLRNTKPRHLKPDLRLGEQIRFLPVEIEAAANAMRAYLTRLDQLVGGPPT
jgi:hypothetical protein